MTATTELNGAVTLQGIATLSQLPESAKVHLTEINSWFNANPQTRISIKLMKMAQQDVINGQHVVRMPIGTNAALYFTKVDGNLNAYVYKWKNKKPSEKKFTGIIDVYSFQDKALNRLTYVDGLLKSNINTFNFLPSSAGGNISTSISISFGQIWCWLTGGTWVPNSYQASGPDGFYWVDECVPAAPSSGSGGGSPDDSGDDDGSDGGFTGGGGGYGGGVSTGGGVTWVDPYNPCNPSTNYPGGVSPVTVTNMPLPPPTDGGGTSGCPTSGSGGGATGGGYVVYPVTPTLDQVLGVSTIAAKSIINEFEDEYVTSFNLSDIDISNIVVGIYDTNPDLFTGNLSDFQNYIPNSNVDDPPTITGFKQFMRWILGLDAPSDPVSGQALSSFWQYENGLNANLKAAHDSQMAVFGFIPGMSSIDNMMQGNYGTAAFNLSFDVFGEQIFKYVAGSILIPSAKYVIRVSELAPKYVNLSAFLKGARITEIFITKGTASGKVLIIGENMAERVTPANILFNKMLNLGADEFVPSAAANADWANRVALNGGQYLSDNQLKQTLTYQENLIWIRDRVAAGYSIIDVGIDVNKPARSVFYTLERSLVYK